MVNIWLILMVHYLFQPTNGIFGCWKLLHWLGEAERFQLQGPEPLVVLHHWCHWYNQDMTTIWCFNGDLMVYNGI